MRFFKSSHSILCIVPLPIECGRSTNESGSDKYRSLANIRGIPIVTRIDQFTYACSTYVKMMYKAFLCTAKRSEEDVISFTIEPMSAFKSVSRTGILQQYTTANVLVELKYVAFT